MFMNKITVNNICIYLYVFVYMFIYGLNLNIKWSLPELQNICNVMKYLPQFFWGEVFWLSALGHSISHKRLFKSHHTIGFLYR